MDCLDPLDARIAAALPPGSLFAVGGRVRDELRSAFEGAVVTKDRDYVVTGIVLEELVERLKPLGRLNVVGASFSVMKLALDGCTVDVALPRRERSVGTGHRDFFVQSGPEITLEEDLCPARLSHEHDRPGAPGGRSGRSARWAGRYPRPADRHSLSRGVP